VCWLGGLYGRRHSGTVWICAADPRLATIFENIGVLYMIMPAPPLVVLKMKMRKL
jgi:hypothetical protein